MAVAKRERKENKIGRRRQVEREHITSALVPRNRVQIIGVVASATQSREGVLSRKIEIPIPGARETLDIECEKPEFFPLFRAFKVGDWISLEGAIRKRFWRSGASVASRSYIQLHSLKSHPNRPTSSAKKR
jgi:hypothetical protein